MRIAASALLLALLGSLSHGLAQDPEPLDPPLVESASALADDAPNAAAAGDSLDAAALEESGRAGADSSGAGTKETSATGREPPDTAARHFRAPWSRPESGFSVHQRGVGATLAASLSRFLPLGVTQPSRAGFRQGVGAHGMHPAATEVYWEGLPLRGAAGPAVDLAIFPAALVSNARLANQTDAWHPSGATLLELSGLAADVKRVRTRLRGHRGHLREMSGEEVLVRAPLAELGTASALYARRGALQPFASWPESQVLDFSASTDAQSRALVWHSAATAVDLRIMSLSMSGSNRPTALPAQGERSTHVQNDEIVLLGGRAFFPLAGVALALSTQESSSEHWGLGGTGIFATLEENHVDAALAYSFRWRERHELRASWRLRQSSGHAAYPSFAGSLFERTLRVQWWSFEDRICLGSGLLRLYGSRAAQRVADYRYALQSAEPSLAENLFSGGAQWSSPLWRHARCEIGGSVHARPLSYLEHLYLADELLLAEQGRSARFLLIQAGGDWQARVGGGLTYWSHRARFDQVETALSDWVVWDRQERQGDFYVDGECAIGRGLRGWAGWRLDGGDLPGEELWRNHLRLGLLWSWRDANRPLALHGELTLLGEHDEAQWHGGLAGRLRLDLTDQFETYFAARGLGQVGEESGPQYAMGLEWLLWD